VSASIDEVIDSATQASIDEVIDSACGMTPCSCMLRADVIFCFVADQSLWVKVTSISWRGAKK